MFFMMFGGAEATPVSCGDHVFNASMSSTERCKILHQVMNSTGCTPTLEAQFQSVNYEFGYYCANTKLVQKSISVQMVGVLIGALTFGQLSDMYGRKNLLLISVIGCLFCTLASAFVNTLWWFTVWRCLLNVFVGGNGSVLHTFMIEALPKKHRFWISNIVGWSINMIFLVIFATFAKEWRTLIYYVEVFSSPALILTLMLYESPRFLLGKQKVDDAKQIVINIYKFDKRPLDKELLDKVLEQELQTIKDANTTQKKYSFWHLFYTPKLTAYTLTIGLTLFTASCLNYSLLFNISKLSGSIYKNALFTAVGRYAVNLIAIFLDIKYQKIGRKTLHAIAEGLIIALFAVYIFGKLSDLKNSYLLSLDLMAIICVTTILFVTGHLMSGELFPTGIRNISFSAGQLFSRCGVIISPQFFLLAELHPVMPYVALLFLAIIDFIIFWSVLRETKNEELIDFMPPKNETWKYVIRNRKNVVSDASVEMQRNV
ncbi:unnamed protein product [Bursaphelenchus okinawaensis]|uniref:Major facilitator superfamily (MFS) profile domain-containing protein n=1 Tax=Bursaphelenchus okinawaensis TaxID=465554 RepID=A0A811L5G2_9BILA|nr:unnamed protein product [Bursaphelenchus okinawaensis]CAG9117989.1 unnamed protein product [Bursaphelenchus okinawaensis]